MLDNGNRVIWYAMGSIEKHTGLRVINLGITTKSVTERRLQHQQSRNRVYHELAAVRATPDDERLIKHFFSRIRLTMENGPNQTEEFYYDARPDFDSGQIYLCESLRLWLLWLQKREFVALKGQCSEITKVPIPTSFTQWDPKDQKHRTKFWLPMRITEEDPFGDLTLPTHRPGVGDYYTPLEIIECVHNLWNGPPDLNPASCLEANRVVRAKDYFTEWENGLGKHWYGKVFLNPPFQKWGEWSPKILSELERGKIESMVLVSNSQTLSTLQFFPLFDTCDAVLVPSGRVQYWGPKVTGGARQGTFIYYYGSDIDGFDREFSHIGRVCEIRKTTRRTNDEVKKLKLA